MRSFDSDDRDYRDITHDLRMRILAGGDVSAHEMLLIVESIRRGRRSAGAPPSRAKSATGGKGKGKASTRQSVPPADLAGILDQEI